MIIAVSGLGGSGKDTLGRAIAKELGLRVVCPTFKTLAEDEGISLMEFQEKAKNDPEIDRKFDDALKRECSAGDCVVTTWLGPWMVEADLRVWVFASEAVRALRIAKRDNLSESDALMHIKKRDADNRERYLKLYGIDILGVERFDVALNSGNYSPEEMASIVAEAIGQKKKR
ncbi:cytidylate kinase family protein [Candidatus Micrarchaeota archaeon]|nr:cytidylate kinase family protein [Candidatus Micrarchaeota archaeon]